MAEDIPDEIWILILGHVRLGDRLKSVQFVNKRLHALCHDPILNVSVNFNSAILLSDRTCGTYISQFKESLKDLSLKDCHWFSDILHSTLPLLPVLQRLDLTGCHLQGSGLYQVLKMTPGLERLAVSISGKELRNYIDKCQKSKEDAPKLCLRTLHIESYPGGISYTDLSSLIARHFFSDSHKRPESFSVDWLTPVRSFLKLYMVPSQFTLDYECDLDLSTPDACRAFCTALLCANFHNPIAANSDGISNYLPRYDLSLIKYLSLPDVMSINWEYDNCNGSKCPDVLPNLECFVFPIFFYREGSCYYALKRELLLSCSFPKLKCLKVTGACETMPEDFYSRISSFKNLEELNLMGIQMDIKLLLNSIRDLKKLERLSIFPLCNSKSCPRSIGGSLPPDSDENLHFSQAMPNLKQLEVSQLAPTVANMSDMCSKLLKDVGRFKNLNKLSLRRVGMFESFSEALKQCSTLSSLSLSQCGKDDECLYPLLLEGVLRTWPNLMELRLQHEMFCFKTKLFEEISECKNIEKVVFSVLPVDNSVMTTWYDDHIASPAFLGHFMNLVHSNCPNLHIFVILANFSRHWCDRWEKYKSASVSSDKRLILECGHPRLITSGRCPVLYKLIDFSKSSISEYNPFNFPYYNQTFS